MASIRKELVVSRPIDEVWDLDESARSDRLAHHHATFQLVPEGSGTRIAWTADVLPHEAAKAIGAMMEEGCRAMKRALE